MPAIQKQPVITSIEEYESLPEDTRAEIFDRDIYYMANMCVLLVYKENK